MHGDNRSAQILLQCLIGNVPWNVIPETVTDQQAWVLRKGQYADYTTSDGQLKPRSQITTSFSALCTVLFCRLNNDSQEQFDYLKKTLDPDNPLKWSELTARREALRATPLALLGNATSDITRSQRVITFQVLSRIRKIRQMYGIY